MLPSTTKLFATTLSVVSVVALTIMTAAPASASTENSTADSTIAAVAPDLLAGAAGVVDNEVGGFFASSTTSQVTMPSSTTGLIQLSAGGADISIRLPRGEGAASRSDRLVAYPNGTESTTLVIPQRDSSLVIAAMLESQAAPETYSYDYPGLRLEATGGGDVVGFDSSGDLALTVALPWALDANGVAVPTHYEVDGSTLKQVVDHRTAQFTYPIIADPTNLGGNSMYTSIVRDADSRGTIIRVYEAPFDFSKISDATIWANYTAITPSAYEGATMRDQLVCHARNVGGLKNPWNLEPWRPNVGYWATVAAACNP